MGREVGQRRGRVGEPEPGRAAVLVLGDPPAVAVALDDVGDRPTADGAPPHPALSRSMRWVNPPQRTGPSTSGSGWRGPSPHPASAMNGPPGVWTTSARWFVGSPGAPGPGGATGTSAGAAAH